MRPRGQLDQARFQLPFPSEVSTWGQLVALHRPSLLCVLFFFKIVKGKRTRKKKKPNLLREQPNSETDAESSRGTGPGAAGSAEKVEAAGPAAAEVRAAAGTGTSRALGARSSGAGAERGAQRGAQRGALAGQEVRGSRGGRPIVRWRRRPGARGPERGGTRK